MKLKNYKILLAVLLTSFLIVSCGKEQNPPLQPTNTSSNPNNYGNAFGSYTQDPMAACSGNQQQLTPDVIRCYQSLTINGQYAVYPGDLITIVGSLPCNSQSMTVRLDVRNSSGGVAEYNSIRVSGGTFSVGIENPGFMTPFLDQSSCGSSSSSWFQFNFNFSTTPTGVSRFDLVRCVNVRTRQVVSCN